MIWQGAFDNGSGHFHSTLCDSIEKEDIPMMHYLGENLSNVDKFDQLEWSCLHTIAYGFHPELITEDVPRKQLNCLKQLFIKHCDNLTQFSKCGNLPIHLACQMNNSLILKIIVDVGKQKLSQKQFDQMMNEKRKNKYWNFTPLMIAIKNISIECVKILCTQKSVIDGILKYKARYPSYNALDFACYYNSIDIVKILSSLCDSKQLNVKEYSSHLIKLANCGVSKGLIGSKCVEFVRTAFENHKPKHAVSISNNEDDKVDDHVPLVCCDNHLLPLADTFTREQCDICQEVRAGCRSCTKCGIKKDSKLFPSTLCEHCVTATSIWSIAQNTSASTSLQQAVSSRSLLTVDIINRVQFLNCVICLICTYITYYIHT